MTDQALARAGDLLREAVDALAVEYEDVAYASLGESDHAYGGCGAPAGQRRRVGWDAGV